MTIRLMNPIDWLLRLASRLAVRRWNDRNRIPDGVPGIRSIANPCECYAPGGRPELLSKRALGCQGDGHYLCNGCKWLVEPDQRVN